MQPDEEELDEEDETPLEEEEELDGAQLGGIVWSGFVRLTNLVHCVEVRRHWYID